MIDFVKKRVRETLEAEEEAVSRLKRKLDSSFFKAVNCIRRRKGKIVITAIGKSAFVGMKMSATFTSLGHTSVFLHPVEALHGDSGVIRNGDVVIALSFSGASPEVVRIVSYLKQSFSISIIAVTGNPSSRLALLSDHVVVAPVIKEGCPIGLAPMASTTATMVIGDLLASALTSPRRFKRRHFAKFHPGGSLGLSLTRVETVMTSGKALPIVSENTTFEKTLRIMTKKDLGIVAAVDGRGRLTGCITDGDIRRILLVHNFSKDMEIKKLMTRSPKSVKTHVSLKETLELMEQFRITSLFVTDSSRRVKGVINIHDIVESNVL